MTNEQTQQHQLTEDELETVVGGTSTNIIQDVILEAESSESEYTPDAGDTGFFGQPL